MKILIITGEMRTLTGSPMYNYTLTIELLRQLHSVDIYSVFGDNQIKLNLEKYGANLIDQINGNFCYDLVLISQNKYQSILNQVKANFIANIVHSEYDPETPIISNRIDKYIAIRPSIKEHLITEHGIFPDKITVIYNGVDLNRFNPIKRKVHKGSYIKVVLPCTVDNLRLPFINHYISKVNKDYRVFIYGHKYHKLPENKYLYYSEAKFDIENYIADADLIPGILLGRINLEAYAMGINTVIHNPDQPEVAIKFDPGEKDFNKKHNIKNVVKEIVELTHSKSKKILSTAESIFTNIYKNNHWGDNDSVSGTGSNLEQTKYLVKILPQLFKNKNIKSILDLPCGDYFWMNTIKLNKIKYIGGDIVKPIIENNKKLYNKDFRVLDILINKIPCVDLIFCRDCLVHFSFELIFQAIQNMKNSGSKYLLTTSFPGRVNIDIEIGGWRPIDLQQEPFNLIPIEIINERCTENNGIFDDKSLYLFELKNMKI